MASLRKNATGKNIVVAVIDSGVDATHPELKDKVSKACSIRQGDGAEILKDEVPPESLPDAYGHGTAVAGIITKLACDAKIINVKVLNEYNSCTGDILIEGLRWALNQKVKLINMSLATSKKQFLPALFELCEQAYCQNTIIVSSMRNCPAFGVEGNLGEYGCPSMFSSVISVDREAFGDGYRLLFNPNCLIEFKADGTQIKVPASGGGHVLMTGTSFATPHVTGIVALLLEQYPEITAFEIKTVLKKMAVIR